MTKDAPMMTPEQHSNDIETRWREEAKRLRCEAAPMDCTCCGEPIVQVPPEGEWSCACEWEGCDKNCPIVGHLYREQTHYVGDDCPGGHRDEVIEDGFGSTWIKCGPGCDLQVVRPGKAQCNCDT